jgi:hypothetical protein
VTTPDAVTRTSRAHLSVGGLARADQEARAERRVDVDRLVDLHVLAANGDEDAAARADEWMAGDPVARRLWDSVARTCDELGATSSWIVRSTAGLPRTRSPIVAPTVAPGPGSSGAPIALPGGP